jgi:hypothetical protein
MIVKLFWRTGLGFSKKPGDSMLASGDHYPL